MNINAKSPLSFGKLIVKTPTGRYDKDNMPKRLDTPTKKFADTFLKKYADNEHVKNLDSKGMDVVYNVSRDHGTGIDQDSNKVTSIIDLESQQEGTLLNRSDSVSYSYGSDPKYAFSPLLNDFQGRIEKISDEIKTDNRKE